MNKTIIHFHNDILYFIDNQYDAIIVNTESKTAKFKKRKECNPCFGVPIKPIELILFVLLQKNNRNDSNTNPMVIKRVVNQSFYRKPGLSRILII